MLKKNCEYAGVSNSCDCQDYLSGSRLSFLSPLPPSLSAYYPFQCIMSSHFKPQMNGTRSLITFLLYNFKWLYLDTSHFLCKARHPASHNPMMQPSIYLHEKTRCCGECVSDARGRSEEAIFP